MTSSRPQPADPQILPGMAAVGRRRHQRPRGTDQRRLRLAGTVRRTHQPAAGILASQEGALREVIHNTGVVFNALAGRDHQLEQLIVNGEHTFHAASAASEAFAQAFRELPPFEHNSKVALESHRQVRRRGQPVLRRIHHRPRRQLSKTAGGGRTVRPPVQRLPDLAGAADEGRQGGAAAGQEDARPDRPDPRKPAPGAAQPRPLPAVHGRVRARAASFFANLTAASQASLGNGNIEAVRRTEGPQAPLPHDDVGARARKPRGVSDASRNRAAATPTRCPAPTTSWRAACPSSRPPTAQARRRRSAPPPAKRRPRNTKN